jgi:transcriptional regulator with XRE-family HTH domain
MFWKTFKNKTVHELRKNQGLTVRELAALVKVNESLIKRIDPLKLKSVPEPLKSRVEPVLRGEHLDKRPW